MRIVHFRDAPRLAHSITSIEIRLLNAASAINLGTFRMITIYYRLVNVSLHKSFFNPKFEVVLSTPN